MRTVESAQVRHDAFRKLPLSDAEFARIEGDIAPYLR